MLPSPLGLKNQQEATSRFFLGLFLDPEDGGDMFLLTCLSQLFTCLQDGYCVLFKSVQVHLNIQLTYLCWKLNNKSTFYV
jgi:hypothetical protein